MGVCCLTTPFLYFRVVEQDELPPSAFARGLFAVVLLALIPVLVHFKAGWLTSAAIIVVAWFATDLLG